MAYPIDVDGKQVEFLTDIGSDTTIIPLRVFDLLQRGKHRMYISTNEKSPNLLSEHACLTLGLLINSVKNIKNECKPPTQIDLPDLLGLNPVQRQRADEVHTSSTGKTRAPK